MIKKLIYKIFSFLPIKSKKVLFFSYYGAQYGGNPKYISQYLSQEEDWQQVWAISATDMIKDSNVKTVKYASIAFLYHLATTQFIITNYRLSQDISKRKDQIYVQTWHSSLRLKKIEKDAEAYLSESYLEMAKKDSLKIDYLLAGCADSKAIFQRSFWYDGRILEIGTPRIDPLLHPSKERLARIKKELGISLTDRVLLYAPTFRNNSDLSVYLSEFNDILKSLRLRFGGNWRVITRLHPHLMHQAREFFTDSQIIEASNYPDIQELLMIADFLITDYSSLMFDFLFTKKPALLFLPDLAEYKKKERDLYYEIEDLPFLKAFNMTQIPDIIHHFDLQDYLKEVHHFIDRIDSYEEGKSSKQLIEILKQHIIK